MPSTLPAATAAVLLLALVTAGGVLTIRRWGVQTRDPLDPVWAWMRDRLGSLSTDVFTRSLTGVAGALADLRAHADAWMRGSIEMVRASAELRPALEAVGGVMLSSEAGADDAVRRRGFFRRRGDRGEESDGLPAEQEQIDEPPVDEAAEQVPLEEPPPARRAPAGRTRERPKINYIPLESVRKEEADQGSPEENVRARFRRGLRKTRDYLNRDVREVFGSGPVPEAFDSLEEILVRADVGVVTALALADELRTRGRELTSDTLPLALRDAMRAQLRDVDRRLRVNPDGLSVWLVVGVNGSGKTTACAKLARHATEQGFEVCLAAADTFRAAAIEQLETWADRVGVDIVRQHPGADPAAVVFDAVDHSKARGFDLVIADTAGRLHTRVPLMEELRKVRRVVDREQGMLTETLLVLDATTGQNGVVQARAFSEAVDVTGLILTKLDGTAKGGIVLAVERELGIPVKAVGVGERAEDLAPFDPDAFVDALFGEG